MARTPTANASSGRSTFTTALKGLAYAALLGLLALGVAVAVATAYLPSYSDLTKRSDLGQMIRVHAANGQVLVSHRAELRQMAALRPDPGRNARGADLDRGPAVPQPHRHRSDRYRPRGRRPRRRRATGVSATSTITQQLARNIFLTNNRNFARKIKEAILALALERKFSKDQILELYLNRVYFGGGAYGIDAASRQFFGHGADHLSLGEAAIIAGLVKAPSNYSPTADIEAARSRSGVVLQTMAKNGFISPAMAASVNPADVRIQQTTNNNSVRYFTDWALPQLDQLIDQTSEPIDVWTTLDPACRPPRTGQSTPTRPNGAQGALVSIDRDGAVRAMVGGKDYVEFDLQPGDPGHAPARLGLQAVRLSLGARIGDEADRHDRRRAGDDRRLEPAQLDPHQSRVRSPCARPSRVRSTRSAPRSASSSASRPSPTWRGGSGSPRRSRPSRRWCWDRSEVRLIDMTRAFASVANKGVAVTPYAIRKVVTADGRLLYQHEADEERVLVAPWVAAEMTDLLQSAVLTGTGRAAQIGRPVAGKTGTTSSNKDGWFIGFSSGLTTGVWMGRDDARTVAGLQGGTAPARAFHDFMTVAVANRPVEPFETQVPMPDWQLTPEEEMYGDTAVDANAMQPMVDENGMPIGTPPPQSPDTPQQQPTVRPDGTRRSNAAGARSGIPATAATSRCRVHRSSRRRVRAEPRLSAPVRAAAAAAQRRRRIAFASARPGPNSRASNALKSAPWLRWLQMRDLVRDDVAPGLRRREDQPPAEANPPLR